MVKKLALFFAYLSFFMLALMYFTPKVSIYYFLETQLKPYDVIISSESVQDSGLTLSIEDGVVFVKSIDSAKIKNVDITILGLYNALSVSEIELSSVAASFVPLKIAQVDIIYSVIDPLNITANAVGEFGEVQAIANLLERIVHVKLVPSALMKKDYKHTLKNLKKSENGEFVYDKTF